MDESNQESHSDKLPYEKPEIRCLGECGEVVLGGGSGGFDTGGFDCVDGTDFQDFDTCVSSG